MDEKRIELLKAMGYSDLGIRFILEKTNVGQIEKPSIYAKEQGTCGDIMILTILIQKNIIKDAKYDYIGCAGLQAAGSALTEIIKGKKIDDIKKLEPKDILDYLGGLPQQKHECAQLACNTLKKGIYQYHSEVKN
jgi:NifU-like protein involved in Fe-S cluster formation